MADTTTIELQQETWRRLNACKRESGESFDDVVNRLLDGQEASA